jgi:hypothetical protein
MTLHDDFIAELTPKLAATNEANEPEADPPPPPPPTPATPDDFGMDPADPFKHFRDQVIANSSGGSPQEKNEHFDAAVSKAAASSKPAKKVEPYKPTAKGS